MLKRRLLGETGLKVSRLCFGSLTLGPLQARLPLESGVELISFALRRGINFIDTAEIYGTYRYIAEALRRTGLKPVIATKSYAYEASQAQKSLEKALREMGLARLDIFLLHEQESLQTLRGHRGAFKYLWKARDSGLIKAVGFSCHTVAAVKAALHFPGIDVIHPLLNWQGIGIRDGSASDMLEALCRVREKGIGVYTMKPLGGGHLNSDPTSALAFLLHEEAIDAVAVGMASVAEVEHNLHIFSGTPGSSLWGFLAKGRKRRLLLEKESCLLCGRCVENCPQSALAVKEKEIFVDEERCILCGYCGAVCPEFALRIG